MAERRPARRSAPAPPPWWGDPARQAVPDGAGRPLLPWSTGTRPADLAAARRDRVGPAPAGLRSSWWTAQVVPLLRSAACSPAVLLAVGVVALALLTSVAVFTTNGTSSVTTPYLTYTPPPGWSTAPPDPTAPTDPPTLLGIAHGPRYTCGGEEFVRGFAGAAVLPTEPTAGSADRAERVARWFAATTYSAADGTPPDVAVAPPRPVRVAGPGTAVEGTLTEATVRAAGDRDGCAATAGRVLVLAVPHGDAATLLLVAGDTAGGPGDPAAPDPSALDAVVRTARLPAT